MGCDEIDIPTYLTSTVVPELFTGDDRRVNEAWRELHKNAGKSSVNSFISNYFNELSSAPEYANVHCHILKTSLSNTITKEKRDRVTVLELNGNIYEGLNSNGKIVEATEQNIDSLTPLFPCESYSNKRKAVELIESCFVTDIIQVCLFIGTSGICPVVESLYNRALVNKSLIVVVNPDSGCYLHDLADISLKIDANKFFGEINSYFSNYSEAYLDCKN
jgi:hypothetical protein